MKSDEKVVHANGRVTVAVQLCVAKSVTVGVVRVVAVIVASHM